MAQYLARLAAEATTIINAADYGRTVYDLATRRELIEIGEDMVNGAFDAPVDFAPRDQIEDAERRLYELAEDRPLRRRLPEVRERAHHRRRHGRASAYQREGKLSGLASACATSTARWAACNPPT